MVGMGRQGVCACRGGVSLNWMTVVVGKHGWDWWEDLLM